jgi:membrane-associated phospholipid phosphatase
LQINSDKRLSLSPIDRSSRSVQSALGLKPARRAVQSLDRSRSAPALKSNSNLAKPGFELSVFSDSGVIGDRKTTLARVTLSGKIAANATVQLAIGSKRFRTIASSDGSFLFDNIPLQLGSNKLTAIAQASKTQASAFTTTIRRFASEAIDPVIAWNAIAIKAALIDQTPAPAIARNLAIVHAAVYDAVTGITGGQTPYKISLPSPAGALAEAATVAAAYDVLISLYPQQKPSLDQSLAQSLQAIPDGQSETDGVTYGNAIANALLALRQTDGANAAVKTPSYKPNNAPGDWRPTPPNFRGAFLPEWGNVTPFALASATQFRPAPPPPLISRHYAKELNQVKQLGSIESRSRTPDQTQQAQFWSSIGGAVYWNELAERITGRVAAHQPASLVQNARLFALLNVAEADAGITAWKTKYTENRWRPIDAIRRADTDRNRLTQPDRHWKSLLTTPSHPDYVSAHSVFSSAAATVLSDFFGDRFSFTSASSSLPGIDRSYPSFQRAAAEAGNSRIYGGIHTQSANRAGLATGRAIAAYVLDQL